MDNKQNMNYSLQDWAQPQTIPQSQIQTQNTQPQQEQQDINYSMQDWANPTPYMQPHQDTLKLEYPALADKIDTALQQGWNRDKLRRYLAERESIALTQYTPQEINQFLGRDDNSIRKAVTAMQQQQENAYVEIMKYDMSADKVRDILQTARLSGIAPGVLLLNPDLLPGAEKLAGERRGFFGQVLAALSNAIANSAQGNAGQERFEIQGLKQLMNDDNALIEEGKRNLGVMPEFAWSMPSDEELKELGRQSFSRMIEQTGKSADTHEQRAQKFAVHVRPPDNIVGATILSAIENSPFTIKSGIVSALAWTFGGPIGGAAGAVYNTFNEAQQEAGGVFMEAIRRGMSPEEAYQRAVDDRNNNLWFLPLSNYGTDYLTHGMADTFAELAAGVTGNGWLSKAVRGAIRFGVPTLIDAAVEGNEEYMQERFKMNALGDEIDEQQLWEAFRMGMADAVIYSAVGAGTRGAVNKVYSLTPAGKQAEAKQQAVNNVLQEIRDIQDMSDKIQNGELQPDTIVANDPVVFIPKSMLDDNAIDALGLQNEIMEDEEGNIIESAQPEANGIDNTEAAAWQDTEGMVQDEEAPTSQATQQEDEEVAVRKSTWDSFKAQYPEQAEKLNDYLREGTQGVTAIEKLARTYQDLQKAANDNPELRQAVGNFSQQLVDAGRTQQEAQAIATVAGAVANSMNKIYGVPLEQAMNVAVKTEGQTAQQNTKSSVPASMGVTDLDTLLARNSEAEGDFRNLMQQLHRDFGGELLMREAMKRSERIIEKVNNDYNGDFSRVVDVWGGSIIFDNEQDLLNALQKLQARGDVVRLKNKWSNPDDTGYRDINANLRLPNGVVVELQLHHRGIMDVKNDVGHGIYEFIRSNTGKSELEDSIDKAKSISKQYYDAGINGGYADMDANSRASASEIARALSSQTSARVADTLLNELSALTRKTLTPPSSETPSTAQRVDALGSLSENSTANGTSSPFSKNLNTDSTSNINSGGNNIARIRTIKGTEVDVRYRIVEAADLIVSTNERGAPNPDYPQELQPRQRNREASFSQINMIAQKLDPELLGENRLASDGAPVIGSDYVVESGNGRTMAIINAYKYKRPSADNYRAWLMENAQRFGLDAAQIEGMNAPVLVRERISDVDRVKFTSEANESSTAQMSMTEHAINDAKKISPEMLSYYDPDKALAANQTFIMAFLNIVPQNERGDLKQANGKISKAGLERVQNALLAKAYNDTSILNRLNELYDDDIKNVSNALIAAAPSMAVFESGGYNPEISIREDLIRAVQTIATIKQDERTVDEFIAQMAMFDDVSDETKKLLQFFDRNKRSAKRIANGLIHYAESAMNEAKQGQSLLFDDSARTKGQILDEAIRFGDTGINESISQSEEGYNQIGGTIAAQNFDEAAGNSMHMDNLAVAQEMSKHGKDAKAIRLATGWELAPDGKWRFEIPDGKLSDNLTLQAQDNGEGVIYSQSTLGQVLDATELFDAYPQLKDYPVFFIEGQDWEFRGQMFPRGVSYPNGTIEIKGSFQSDGNTINPANNNNTLSVLLHEIQHQIQYLEGFEKGSSLEQAMLNSPEINEYREKLAQLEPRRDELLNAKVKELETERIKARRTWRFGELEREARSALRRDNEEYRALDDQIEHLKHERDNLYEQGFQNGRAVELYERSSGEVESRNVQSRMNMSEEQRRNTTLEETEDVPREQQILEGYNQAEGYYQTAQTDEQKLEQDLQIWSENVDKIIDGDLKEQKLIKVMDTPKVFQLIGAQPLPIYMDRGKIHKILIKHENITPEIIKQIPKAITDPIAIFSSATQPHSIVVLTEIIDSDGGNVIVPVHLDKKQENFLINKIASVYVKQDRKTGKPNKKWFTEQVEKGRLLYINNEKNLQQNELQLLLSSTEDLQASIPNENDLAKLRNNTPQSQLDEVRRQYEGTDKWLKAPNGKDTNLTEQQWLLVRTPNFKNWFGDWENDPQNASKVVDRNGEPLVVYHGTHKGGFSIFNTQGSGKTSGTGSWFNSNQTVAETYSSAKSDNGLYPVFLNIRNPYEYFAGGRNWDSLRDIYINDDYGGNPIYRNQDGSLFANLDEAYDYIENVLQYEEDYDEDRYYVYFDEEEPDNTDDFTRSVWNGDLDGDKTHDGVIFEDIQDNGIETDEKYTGNDYVIRNSNQVKSAIANNGEFSTTNPDIYYQEANNEQNVNARTTWPKGTSSEQTQSLVEFFASANQSSGFHELGHHIFRVLTDSAILDNASDVLVNDVDTIFRLAGVDKQDFYNNIGDTRKTAHEYFARSLEEYLHNGKAPTPELQGTFDRVKNWLVNIYRDIVQAFGFKLNPEMQDIFDRLLATPEQLAEQQSLQDINTLYETTQQELSRLQDEIAQLEQQAADNSQQWEQAAEQAYSEGVRQGREGQQELDAINADIQKGRYGHALAELNAKRELQLLQAKQRTEAKIAKLKQNFKLLQERQRERRRITQKARQLRNSIKRMANSTNLIWSRQQEIHNLLDTYDVSQFSRYSLQDIQYIQQQVKQIYDTGRRELAAKRLLENERIESAREQLRGIMRTLPQPENKGAIISSKDTQKQYKGVKGFGQKIIDWTMAKTMSAQRFFDFLDNNNNSHAWRNIFVDQANTAYDTELRHKFSRMDAMEKTMQKLGITPEMLAETRDVDVPHEGSRGWTVDELMSIYAGMKNTKSRDAILYGNFRNAGEQAEAWAAKCIEALSDSEKALADAVINEYEDNFDRINQALIDIYNQGMEHEPNYTPMRRLEYTSSNRSMIDPDAAEHLMTSQAGSGMAGVERGFSKKRRNFGKSNQNGIQLGLMAIWHSQIEAQEHAAAFGQYVRDLRRILLGRDENHSATIRQLVKQVYGKDAWDMIRQYFNIVAADDVQNAYDTLDHVSRWLARNMSVAYLCGNLGTILKQLGSIPRVLPHAGAVATINSIGQFLQNPHKFMETCYQLDPQLRNRKGDPIIRALQQESNGIYQSLLKWGSEPIGWADRAASAIVFKAAYDANLKHGLSQEQAVREAQRVVLTTQPATHKKDKPLVWQQHGYARLVMMFSNDMAQTFGITLYDLTQAIRRGEIPKALSTLVGLSLSAAIIKALTSGAPDEPDDPEEWAKWLASAFTEQSINSIPLVGKEALTLWDSRRGYLNGHSAFIAPFAKLLSGVNGLWDDKKDNNERAVLNLIEGGSLLAPFPATALRRLWYMLKTAGKGEVGNAVKELVGIHKQDKKLQKAAGFR